MMITLNGEPARTEATTVARLLAGRDPRGLAVAVNGTVVRRAEHPTQLLADGDRVEIVTAVQGG